MRLFPVALAVAAGAALSARFLAAQCPDGTPPPCAGQRPSAPAPNSVAVLYLDNLSRDTADAFLADGLTEEIIVRLGQVPRLEVKSRFEVERFRGHSAALDATALGRMLRAAYLVTGSVQRSGDRVRLRYEVIRTATRARVGGDVIDRADSDLLSVESDIAQAVTTAVTGRLLPEERSRLGRPLTTDPAAYEQYLRGVEEMNHSYDEPAVRSALAHFDLAVARDPAFASAYAMKALAWELLADAYVSPREGYGNARDAATKALALDSSQARAYAALGLAVLALDFDAREAERLGRLALKFDSGSDYSHQLLNAALTAAGRMDEAFDEARKAWLADSLSSFNAVNWVGALLIARRLDSAAAVVQRVRTYLPSEDVRVMEGSLAYARGDFRSAARLLSWRFYGGSIVGMYVRARLALGDTVTARAAVDSLLVPRTQGYLNPVALVLAYTALGEMDKAIEWLRRAIEERTLWLTNVRVLDDLAPLRADPRYAALDRQLRY